MRKGKRSFKRVEGQRYQRRNQAKINIADAPVHQASDASKSHCLQSIGADHHLGRETAEQKQQHRHDDVARAY